MTISQHHHSATCDLQAELLEEASFQVQVHSMAPAGNQWIDCHMEKNYSFVTVQTLSGHVHRQAVRIVTLLTERTGRRSVISMAPLLSILGTDVCD